MEVADVMTRDVVTVGARTPLKDVAGEAAAAMLEHSVNRLPVVDAHGGLIGIVTRTDLLRAFLRDDAQIERAVGSVPGVVAVRSQLTWPAR